MRLALALLLPLSAAVRSTCTTAYPGSDTELNQARYLGEAVRPAPQHQFGVHAGAYHAPAMEPPAAEQAGHGGHGAHGAHGSGEGAGAHDHGHGHGH